MTTLIKIALFLASALLVIALVLTVLVRTQITPEKVRETLIPLVEKKLQRKVDVGVIDIGIFSGITLDDLQVMKKDGEDEFFSIQRLELHYRLLPLFAGKIVVDKIFLYKPKISITRTTNGQFNFSDLLPDEKIKRKVVAEPRSSSLSIAKILDLLVKEVVIKDGELLYVDKFKNPRTPFRYTLNKLNFKARQITVNDSFPFDFSAVINGSNIDISGHYDLSRQIGDLTIHLASIDVIPFTPYYRASFPGKLSSAQLALELELDIQPDLIASKGKVTFDNVDMVLDQRPDLNVKKATLGAAYAFKFNTKKQLLKVSTLLLDFNKIKLGAEGKFDLSTDKPSVEARLFLKKLDLREMMQNLPEQLSRDYQKYSFAGLIDGQIDFSGKLDSGAALLDSAQLKLSDLRASFGGLRAGASGKVSYSDNTLQTDNLLLQYGDQQIQLKGRGKRGSDEIFHGQFELSADRLNLNKILSESGSVRQPEVKGESESDPVSKNLATKKTTISAAEQQKTLADDIGPFDIPVDMHGTLAIKRLIYRKLNVDKISADVSLQNNNLQISDLIGKIDRGEVRGSSLVDLGVQGLSYRGAMSLTQPNVTTLVSGLFPDKKQNMSGSLQLQNNFSGRGTLADTLLPALKLKGTLTLQQGTIKGFPILDNVADFLGNGQLKALRFQSLTVQYDLYKELAQIIGKLDSSKTKFISTGTVDINGPLNLKLDARFAPAVLKKMGLKKKLRKSIADQDGWGALPLQIRGTLDQPKVSYDSVALQEQMVDKASQKLLEKLGPEGDGEVEPIKKMLDNTLNKLFGK